MRCDRVVVAVDGCLERVLPELSERVRTARAQALATGPASDVTLPRPVYARYGYDYWQQLPDGRVVLGGGRDLGGETEWSCEAETSSFVQSPDGGLVLHVVSSAAGRDRRPQGALLSAGPGRARSAELVGREGDVHGHLAEHLSARLALGDRTRLAQLVAGAG